LVSGHVGAAQSFGGRVRVVNGAYRGEEAVLLGINAAEYSVRDRGLWASAGVGGSERWLTRRARRTCGGGPLGHHPHRPWPVQRARGREGAVRRYLQTRLVNLCISYRVVQSLQSTVAVTESASASATATGAARDRGGGRGGHDRGGDRRAHAPDSGEGAPPRGDAWRARARPTRGRAARPPVGADAGRAPESGPGCPPFAGPAPPASPVRSGSRGAKHA